MPQPKKVHSAKIDKLATQLAKDPRSKAFIPLAEEYVQAGMLQEAALVLEDGLKGFPSFVTALVSLGRVYMQLKRPAEAQPNFEEAIKLSPDNLLAHRMLARIYAENRNIEAAARSCDLVLFQHPKDKEMLALQSKLAQHGSGKSQSVPEAPSAIYDPSLPLHKQYGYSHVPQKNVPPSSAVHSVPEGMEPEVALVATMPSDPPALSPRMVRLIGLLERIQERRAS